MPRLLARGVVIPFVRMRAVKAAVLLASAFTLVVRLSAQDAPRWPDTFTGRLEVLALMQTLNAGILASRSATATLETWCGDHHMADPPRIVADLVPGAVSTATAERLARLE